MTRTLEPGGTVRLYRLDAIVEGDGSMQVALGVGLAGEIEILVRLGTIVSAMSIEGAEALGRELASSTSIARYQRDVQA